MARDHSLPVALVESKVALLDGDRSQLVTLLDGDGALCPLLSVIRSDQRVDNVSSINIFRFCLCGLRCWDQMALAIQAVERELRKLHRTTDYNIKTGHGNEWSIGVGSFLMPRTLYWTVLYSFVRTVL
ncbi:hypothetical protein F2Q68_00016967 [Brassica cretica]|uniref:Uncharacterized protein n=1 Tax=Brassica cretica TaxID=69181 RepID=A0A8S9HPZ1_BRACR|nr:hypothetical protein F2Q68_00016967 [Brassica cretica]